MKVCSQCNAKKPRTTEFFYRNKKSEDGLRAACKDCLKEYNSKNKHKARIRQRKYVENNRESVRKRQKEYYIKHKEEKKDYDRKYYQENKDVISQKQKEYYKQNFERIQKYNRERNADPEYKKYRSEYRKSRRSRDAFLWRQWKENNKDKIANIKQRRYNRMKGLEHSLTDEEWEQACQYFDHSCAYCGEVKPLEREHFIPVSKGGGFTKDNIIPACTYCNTSKLDRSFFEWYPYFIYYSEERENKIIEYLGYKLGDIQENVQDL